MLFFLLLVVDSDSYGYSQQLLVVSDSVSFNSTQFDEPDDVQRPPPRFHCDDRNLCCRVGSAVILAAIQITFLIIASLAVSPSFGPDIEIIRASYTPTVTLLWLAYLLGGAFATVALSYSKKRMTESVRRCLGRWGLLCRRRTKELNLFFDAPESINGGAQVSLAGAVEPSYCASVNA